MVRLDLIVFCKVFGGGWCFDDFTGCRILKEQCVREEGAALDLVIGNDFRVDVATKSTGRQILVDIRCFLQNKNGSY